MGRKTQPLPVLSRQGIRLQILLSVVIEHIAGRLALQRLQKALTTLPLRGSKVGKVRIADDGAVPIFALVTRAGVIGMHITCRL